MLCCSISDFDFLGPIGGKKGVAASPAHKGLGPQNPTKMLAQVGVTYLRYLRLFRRNSTRSSHAVTAPVDGPLPCSCTNLTVSCCSLPIMFPMFLTLDPSLKCKNFHIITIQVNQN